MSARNGNGARSRADLLDRIVAQPPPAFALVHRPESGSRGWVDVLRGDVIRPARLADVPLPEAAPGGSGGSAGYGMAVTGPRRGPAGVAGHAGTGQPTHDVLVVVPYRQITERGFTAPDDGAPLIAMAVTEQDQVPVDTMLARLPDEAITLTGSRFDVPDGWYASTVRRIIDDEIGTGEGANFVIKRSFQADITGYTPRSALSFFRRLLRREQGAYWTFLIHTGECTLVGATPERHITVHDGTAVMNPISGTYRYPSGGPTLEGIKDFLADPKETDELYMVVDEELKMMARICDSGGRAVGPYLKEMARLAHTEYFIEGRTSRDVREILRETMFAPTVTGSPLESATRVIQRYEPTGRRYYSGIAALIGRDAQGGRTLDSAILIRTADIDPDGRVDIAVGATLVRHSDPISEAAETRAKAAALINALDADETSFRAHPEVQAALLRRNAGIAEFWLRDGAVGAPSVPTLARVSALVIDAEDTFTEMIAHQLRALGVSVAVRRFDEPYVLDAYDLVVLGPGPGDPRAVTDPRIGALWSLTGVLLERRRPFVAVCLSHQVLSLRLGFDLARRDVPNQGVQREIDLFGARERVGFYNTFAARCDEDKRDVGGIGVVEVSRDQHTGEVHALRGQGFASMQFHAESVLTVDGPRIVAGVIEGVLGG